MNDLKWNTEQWHKSPENNNQTTNKPLLYN